MFFRIAFRNLMRHRTRTLILGGAIASVAFLLTFLIALVAGVKNTMIRNGTALMTGHVNIAGFYKMSQSSALPLVTEFPPLLEIAKREVPEAKLIIDRMKAYGKVISDRDSMQLPLWGVRMEQEKEVLAKLELAEPKDYIEDLETNSSAIPPQRGSLQDLGSKSSIALFASQAKKLKVRVGDMVTVSLTTYRNMSNTKDVKVVAVLKDLGLMSQFSAYAHTEDTLEIYQLKETTTGQIMIFLQDIKQVPAVEERLRKAIAKAGYEVLEKDPNPFFFKFDRIAGESWTGQRIDITTWEDETSFLKWIVNLLTALTYVLIFILLIIIVIGLMNALWMSIRERTSEIGTLRAIGLQKSQVFQLFLLESCILTFLSSAVGATLGMLVTAILDAKKIEIGSEALRMFLMSNRLEFVNDITVALEVIVVLVVFLTLGSLVPIWQASRLKPISAIQNLVIIFCLTGFMSIAHSANSQEPLDDKKALELVKVVDDRQANSGDYKALAFVKENEKNKEAKLFQSVVYRRDSDNKFMLLFTKPKEEAGKSYLKIDKNLWSFDPGTGKWERRTEREKIGGTNSRRADYDESRVSEEYNVKADGIGTLGSFKTYQVKCEVKEGVDVAYPILKMAIDQKDGNLLKREEYALSGKLMRTTYYPKWTKLYSESKKGDVFVPEEIRIFDELEKGNSTIIVLKEVDLKKLEDNIFTKAWIESKSR